MTVLPRYLIQASVGPAISANLSFAYEGHMAATPTRSQLEQKIKSLEKKVAELEEAGGGRQTEIKLHHREELLRIFVDNAPVSVVMCDNKMRWLAYSRQLLLDYNLEDKDYVGAYHYDIVPDLPPHWKQDHQKVLAGEHISVAEEKITRKNGRVEWVRRELLPWRDSQGKIGGILIFNEIITKRKKAEEKLRALQIQQEAILNNIPDYAWLKDRESRFIAVNKAFGEACGIAPEDLIGKTDFNAWPKGLASRYRADDRDVIRTRERKVVDEPLSSADGTKLWLETIKTPIFETDGSVVGTAGIARNITARKLALEALKESEQRFSKAFYHSPDILIITRVSDGLILEVNDSVYRLAGYTREEMTGKTTFDLNLWVDLNDRENFLKTLQTEGNVRDVEFRFRIKSGEIRIGQVSGSLIHLGGEVCVLAVVRDITDRILADKTLQAEKERLAVTLHSIGDGVITTDKHGRVTMLNRIAERLTGWNGIDAVGMPLERVFRIVDEFNRLPCQNPVEQVISSGEIVGLAQNTILISKDGREHLIADSGAPILDSEKRIVGVVLVFRDISESRKMEKEILKVEKLESLGVLAGGIAHDFNNFLSGILGNLSLAKLEAKAAEPIYAILEEMEHAALRAKNLTLQLLTFSKGGDPVRREADLTRLVKESALFAARGSNVRCEFALREESVFSDIDEGQIAQVIHNLTLNAIQAMPRGGVILISEEIVDIPEGNSLSLESGRFVKLTLQDHGTGIPKEHLVNVFDPYFTTKEEGSGLGLSVANSVIEKHNGRITLESEPGVGSTFAVYLKFLRQGKPEEESQKEGLKPGGGRILVMDDEEVILRLVSRMLTKLGYTISVAHTGEEAVTLYREALDADQAFDAVILDLTVPGGIGGKEVIKELLEIDADIKAIVSSGYSRDPVLSDYTSYGFQLAVSKPYQIQELGEALHTVLHA